MRQLTQREIRYRVRRDESLRNRAYREQVMPVSLKIHGFVRAISSLSRNPDGSALFSQSSASNETRREIDRAISRADSFSLR